MQATLGPMSELSAVNELLAAIGEDPVEILELLPPSGLTALEVLRRASGEWQAEGFWFNRQTGVILEPDASGRIPLPFNALSITSDTESVTERGEWLFDRAANSADFSRSVTCEIVYHLTWEELPAVARRLITALAVEKFTEGFQTGAGVTEARARNLMRAKVAFERAVIRAEGLNLLNNTTIMNLTRRG